MIAESETTEVAPVTRLHWFARIATALLAPLVVLGIVEVCLRVAGVGYPTELLVPCKVQGSPASCYNLFFAAPFFPAGMVQTPRLYAIPAHKPPGTYRIFVLGESAAMGDPDPAYSFSRYLEVMLRQRFPSTNFEVVNTGIVAINSHVVLRIAKDLATQRPDLFIIYAGNNEVVGPYGSGTVLTSSAISLPVIRSSIYLRSTRIGELLAKSTTKKKTWGGMQMFLDKQVAASSPQMKHVYANFETNLRDIIAAARKSGARVIVSTVAVNLKDCAPFASQHREGLTQDELRQWTAQVQQAADLDSAGSYKEALNLYQSALRIDDQHAELEFRIAECLWKMGDYQGAKEHFVRARDLDTLRFRTDSRINDINRTVASSFSGVGMVDAEATLANATPDGIVGSDLFYEHVHLTPEGNYLLARAIFLQIASNFPPEAGHSVESDVPSQAECDRLLALTRYDRSRIAVEMLRRLQKPPFTNQLNHSEQILRLAMKAEPSHESPSDTALQYQWAIGRAPDDRMLRYRYGMFLLGYDRAAAAQELGMAQPWDGYPVFLPDGTRVR